MDVSQKRFPLVIVVEDVRSLYNVGAFFRTADALNVQKLFLCGITGYPPILHDRRLPSVQKRMMTQVEKTALGTTESVSWEYQEDTASCLNRVKKEGFTIVAVEKTPGSVPYTSFSFPFPLCLIFGHEREGVKPPTLKISDAVIHIPMSGKAKSLNVVIACAIVAFEAKRQYGNIDRRIG